MTDKLRRLQVNLDDIADAMEYRDPMMMLHSYLDTETGEVITVSSEELSIVEGIYQTHDQEEHDKPLDLAAILAKSDYPQWQIEIILEAERVEMGYGTRYISLPEQDSREGYSDMEAFIPTVDDQRLQNLLWRAIEGRGAFRRFKDVLERERRTRERWFTFQGERRRERAHHWLESEGIEAIHIPRSLPEDVPAQPDPRQRLLEEVLHFTTAARQLTGVTRITLIGSLTTDEPDPDDADILVTVADDMNLEPLAALGRKLSGHAQSLNRGGEVFLADPQGNYLGRTCPWKRCGPGIRLACEAQHCGQRHYLYDDLQNLRLKKSLIAEPPIELWPPVVTRVLVPEDVQRVVLAHLQD